MFTAKLEINCIAYIHTCLHSYFCAANTNWINIYWVHVYSTVELKGRCVCIDKSMISEWPPSVFLFSILLIWILIYSTIIRVFIWVFKLINYRNIFFIFWNLCVKVCYTKLAMTTLQFISIQYKFLPYSTIEILIHQEYLIIF